MSTLNAIMSILESHNIEFELQDSSIMALDSQYCTQTNNLQNTWVNVTQWRSQKIFLWLGY